MPEKSQNISELTIIPEIIRGKGMLIISAPCWQCDKDMLVALVGSKDGQFSHGPEDFSESERKLAEQSGVQLKTVSSKTASETYLANVCGKCDAFVGKWFYFASYYTEALYGRLEYKFLDLNA